MVQDVMGYACERARGLIGECDVPGNPAVSVMALALAAKCEGTSRIAHFSSRSVVTSMIQILQKMGVGIVQSGNVCDVTGGALTALDDAVAVGDSDMLLGCLAGLTAGSDFYTKFEGVAPAEQIVAALEALSVRVEKPAEGVYPFSVGGQKPAGANHCVETADSAVKAAFFLAGLDADGDVHLEQPVAGDDDFEVLLKASGALFEKEKEVGKDGYHLKLSHEAKPQGALHDLPGDPDAALFLLGVAAMLPRSELVLHYVGNDWKTRRALELLRRFNAQLEIQVARSESKFAIRTVKAKSAELRRTRIAGDQTALFLNEVPFLTVLGTQAAGETVIRDAQKLRAGPSDCLALLVENLRLMGAKVGEMPDGVVVQGPVSLQGAEVDAKGDERVALALALAGLVAEGETHIANVGSMTEAYAELFSCLETVVNTKR